MRYTGLQKRNDTVYAVDDIYNSRTYVSPQANAGDPFSAMSLGLDPFRTEKELKTGPDGIKYYTKDNNDAAILLPETHPFFNYPLLVYQVNLFIQQDASQDVKYDLIHMLVNLSNKIIQ